MIHVRRLPARGRAVAWGALVAAALASAVPLADGAARESATCAPTVAMTEGPYFKAGSPRRSVLTTAGMPGRRLTLSGRVLSAGCAPLAGARVEFWQANAAGEYDNSGYRLRGHLFTDAKGRYRLETIIPGIYPGRTEHIHVKVLAPGHAELTTQLYFPGVAQNGEDGIFDPANVVTLRKVKPRWRATYSFVVT